MGGAACLLGCGTWSRLQARWSLVFVFFSKSSFSIEISVIFSPNFISNNTRVKKPKRWSC
jgi:hypothetical protein